MNGTYQSRIDELAHDVSKYAGHGRSFLITWTRVFPELVV